MNAGRTPMIRRLRMAVCLFFVLALILLGAGPAISAGGPAPASDAPAKIDKIGGRLKAELKKEGLEVKEGYFQLWRIEDCPASFKVMGTCFFNNPTAPYVLPALPYWPDEFVDRATAGAFGKTRPGYGTTFRFDPHEAIVIYGVLPPEAAYFGLQTYLFTHKGEYNNAGNPTYELIKGIGAESVFFHAVPANPERKVVFSSLSDSANNVVVEQESGGSWNQFRYFIITPDQGMDEQIRQVLDKLSVADADIFTESIPSNALIGLDADADDFLTGFRYSMPFDGGAQGTPSARWRHNPTMRVLRIRDARSDEPAERYPAWEDNSPESRTAVDERDLKPDLSTLVYKVSQTWGQECVDAGCSAEAKSFIDTQSKPFNLVGPLCDNIGMDCQGDTQDASYQFRGGLGFDNDEVYAVIGTLGTATGNATYVSLGVNNFRLRLGAKNVEGSMLAGSADPTWYPGVNNLDKFYVYYFTRTCAGLEDLTHGYCTSVEDAPLVIPAGDKASLVERDYLKVGTQRGPDSRLTLPSMLLKLQRPAQ